MFSYSNKTAVVTGGGSGIGKAIAVSFAKQGAVVHIVELQEESANDVIYEIKQGGGKAFVHACDVSNQQKVLETFGKINTFDVLVNSAGISHIGKLENTSEEDFTRLFQVNVKGVYNC